MDGDQILPTLGHEIGLQSETVDAAKAGLVMVFDGNWPDDTGSLLYILLGDLWISTRRNYCDILQKRRLSARHANVHYAIGWEINESLNQVGNPCGWKRELIRRLLGGDKRGKWGILFYFDQWGAFVAKIHRFGEMRMILSRSFILHMGEMQRTK